MKKKVIVSFFICLIIAIIYSISSGALSKESPLGQILAFNESPATDSPKVVDPNCQQVYGFFMQKLQNKRIAFDNRFYNRHVQVGNEVYRLRFFYDDGDEGEVPTFQVFLEDEEEFPSLIETTKDKPGPKFLEIQAAKAEILYQEDGYQDRETGEFLHVENDEIIKVISDGQECMAN